MMGRTAIFAMALAVCACGAQDRNRDGLTDTAGFPTVVNGGQSSTPTASLGGRVLESSGAPLVDAVATALVGGASTDGGETILQARTNADGYYQISNLPAGSYLDVSVTKDGYTSARTQGTLPAAIGITPVSNGGRFFGEAVLLKKSQVRFRVIDSAGRPAAGARARVEVTPQNFFRTAGWPFDLLGGLPLTTTPLVVETTADANGILTFAGVPSAIELRRAVGLVFSDLIGFGQYVVTVDPLDADGDGVFESSGTVEQYLAAQLAVQGAPAIALPALGGSSGPFQLASASPPSLRGNTTPSDNIVSPAGPLLLTFNHPLDRSSVAVQVVNENGVVPVAMGAPVYLGPNAFSIAPTAPFTAGQEFNLRVHAVAADNGEVVDRIGFFFAGTPGQSFGATTMVVSFKDIGNGAGGPPDNKLNPGESVEVRFSVPTALSNGNGAPIAFLDADLDGNGVVGSIAGELGFQGSGLPFLIAEPVVEPGRSFDLVPSGYSTRWQLVFSGPASVTVGTAVHLPFQLITTTAGFDTVWGQRLSGDLTAPLTKAP